ncbi:MAG: cystathionine beta-lyase [Alphaproteobacteria bacterium]|nr:cystathionine beta-lyase [Alphaproteobacteria bacterium]
MKDETKIVHAGRDSAAHSGAVNTPVYHASTILFPTLAALDAAPRARIRYARRGTPTLFALEDALTALEGGAGAALFPSGLAAAGFALLSCLKTGDHVLLTDSVYDPVRAFADRVLTGLGIAVEYYDPLIGGGMTRLLRSNTRVVYCESPGSHTFEIQDLPAIAATAHAGGASVIADNTWATPLLCKPLSLGADIVIHAATKYIGGHSDLMLGVLVANEATVRKVKLTAGLFGQTSGPDDIFMTLRGLRSLKARLDRHSSSARRVSGWLQTRAEVARVLDPSLPDFPGHALWKRDFAGASGLFSFILGRDWPRPALAAMLDGMQLFKMGYSWGGFESLILPFDIAKYRSATRWETPGPAIRLSIGLEDPDELIADLAAGFARLTSAAS